jgi:hypothetical protein
MIVKPNAVQIRRCIEGITARRGGGGGHNDTRCIGGRAAAEDPTTLCNTTIVGIFCR